MQNVALQEPRSPPEVQTRKRIANMVSAHPSIGIRRYHTAGSPCGILRPAPHVDGAWRAGPSCHRPFESR